MLLFKLTLQVYLSSQQSCESTTTTQFIFILFIFFTLALNQTNNKLHQCAAQHSLTSHYFLILIVHLHLSPPPASIVWYCLMHLKGLRLLGEIPRDFTYTHASARSLARTRNTHTRKCAHPARAGRWDRQLMLSVDCRSLIWTPVGLRGGEGGGGEHNAGTKHCGGGKRGGVKSAFWCFSNQMNTLCDSCLTPGSSIWGWDAATWWGVNQSLGWCVQQGMCKFHFRTLYCNAPR